MASVEEEPMDVDSTIKEVETNEKLDDAEVSDEGLIEEDNILESRYENKAGTFTTGINIFGEEEKKKMEERAKRFGLKDNNKAVVENGEDLYSSMGVLEENENSKYIRLNVIHMRGTEDMSTKDVFKYFEDYGPASIEWINDICCNVVWLDNISAARALLGRSKKIVGLSEKLQRENKDEENDNELVDVESDQKNEDMIHLKDIECPLPPGLWRKGVDYPKSKAIFLRFATKNDKKQPKAERMSEYYKKYGNPNFGGMRGILTESRKRQYRQIRNPKSRKSSENEENGDKKNPWGDLSENWGAAEHVEDSYVNRGQSAVVLPREFPRVPENFMRSSERGSVKERLGIKPPREVEVEPESSSESESEDSDEEWMKKSKIPRMRMHADDEEEKVKKRKLKQAIHKVPEESTDLRSRLGRRRPPPQYREDIQVIVTNNPEKYRSRREEEVSEEEIEESEKEEGEWEEGEVEEVEPEEIEEEAPEEVVEEEEEEEESDSDSSSEVSEKEVQGPKGSVIKVVARSKPRVASTVWARLNYNSQSDNSQSESGNSKPMKADLRSRLGNPRRERSPLRIEVKNDNFHREDSD